MLFMADASTPPINLPPDTKVVCGYIGGGTPHVWTNNEWNRYRNVKRLPIWVNNGTSGSVQAFQCLMQMYERSIPRKSRIVLDMETTVDSIIVSSFYSVMHYFGFKVWTYGSASTVLRNPPCDGYWVADWTGTPHMYPGKMVRATQYESGQLWDRSVIKTWVYRFARSVWWTG